MKKPNRLGMYADVQEILDAALRHSGGTVELASHNLALAWRHRAYKFRKLYAEILGPSKLSKYDRLSFPKIPPDSSTVVIELRSNKSIKFRPASPDQTEIPDEDEIGLAAEAIARAIDEGEL